MGHKQLRLPPDAPPEKRYSMPDTRELDFDAYQDWRDRVLFSEDSPERSMLFHLMSMAGAYDHLTTHPAGTEAMVRKLREVRRALREGT